MKKILFPAVLLLLSACQPAARRGGQQSIDSLLDDTVTEGVTPPEAAEGPASKKVSYERSFTAPNGIKFNITTLGEDSIRHMQIIAVKDGIFLTDIMEDIIGELIIVRITDLNENKNPELLIFTETRDEHEYWNLYAYEFADKNWNKVYFPELTEAEAQGYKGLDVFRLIGSGRLRRTFPVFLPGDSSKPSGGKRVIEYLLNDKGEMFADTLKTE